MAITGPQYIALEWSLLFITLCIVSLRQYLMWLRYARLRWADFFVFMAWVFFASQTCMDTALLSLGWFYDKIVPGLGKYGPEHGLASYSAHVSALKIVYVETSIYYSEMYCVKWAMLAFYDQLFPPSLKKLRIALKITIYFTVLSWAVSLLVKLFVCQPIRTNWDPEDYCNTNASFISNSVEWALHVFTDLIIYILPLFLLRKLQLPFIQKVGVAVTFSLGFICIIFANMFQISILIGDPNSQIWLYSVIEQSWALIVVCCPSFKQLLTRKGFKRALQGRFAGSNSDGSNDRTNNRYGQGSRTGGKSQNSQGGNSTTLMSDRFSRHASKNNTTIFVTQTNGSMTPPGSREQLGNGEEERRDMEMGRPAPSMAEGITVSYEMETQTHAGSTEKITPNVSTSAWSAL